ncbi:protein rep [Myxococcota bacterium]|nr:protein rep [Myxococcota bacterium]
MARVAGLRAVADRVEACGTGGYLYDARPGQYAMVLDRRTGLPICALSSCRHRLCVRCAPAWAAKLGTRLVRLVSAHFKHHPVFVTLTAATEASLPVADAADRLIRAVGRLRGYVAWKKVVRGGVFGLDFDGPGGRHAHLHACVDAMWIDQHRLLVAWRRALRAEAAHGAQNGGVHVERARDLADVVRYCVKTFSADQFTDEDLPALLRWMNRRHLVRTFGSLRGVKLSGPTPAVVTPGSVRPRAPRLSGVNAATGEPVPEAALVWQFSARANHLGALAASGVTGSLRMHVDVLPDDAAGPLGRPADRGAP